jgi:hypothetical protein
MYIPCPLEFKREPIPIFLNRLGRSDGAGIGWDGVPPAGSEGRIPPSTSGKAPHGWPSVQKNKKMGFFT